MIAKRDLASCLLAYSALAFGFWASHLRATELFGGSAKDNSVQAKQKTEQWKSLFDGKTLTGWKSANFGGEGEVHVKDGALVMDPGNDMTGATYTKGDFPKMNYEVVLEAKRLKGGDFFGTTTFPVGDTHCSLVLGGWGGGVVGLSSIDLRDASDNDTTKLMNFKQDQWYKLRIRVTKDRIQAWIDDQKVVDADTKGKKISIRPECNLCRPFGVATWRTQGAIRNLKVRTLTAAELGGAKPVAPKDEDKKCGQ